MGNDSIEDTRKSAAGIAAAIMEGSAREQDVQLLAMMVLGRDRPEKIDGVLVSWWLMAHGWQPVQFAGTVEFVSPSETTSVFSNYGDAGLAPGRILRAAKKVSQVLGQTEDSLLAEWLELTMLVAKDQEMSDACAIAAWQERNTNG